MTDIFSDRSAAASCVAAVLGLFFASGCEGIVGGIGAGDGGRCTSSTQCKAGEVCRNYSCVAAGACTKKSDCMSDEDCIEGKCSAAAADAGNGRSDGGRSDGGSPCQKDEECAGGYRCEPTTRLCEPVAVIEVTPAGVLDFGPVPAAETDTKLVTIQNKGRAVLYLTGFDLANPKDNPCFLIHSGGISTELPEGATHRLEIRYRQEDDLADEGTLSIISSDPYKGAYPLKLRSTYRGSPDFAVFARDPATMQWNADYPKPGSGYEYAVDLGYVTQGTVRKTVIGMKNATTGDAILAIRAMVPKNTPKNPFAYRFMNGPDPETAAELPAPVLTAPLTHVYLSAGVMVYLHADYDAKSKVDQDGLDLELVANDGDMNNSGAAGHNAVTIKYSVRSMESAMEVAPLSLDFGNVPKGLSVKKTVTIKNSGDADLHLLTGSGLKSASGTMYSLNPVSIEGTIPGKGSLPVEVSFTPTKVASELNYLVVKGDDKRLPLVEVPLTGTGIDPNLYVASAPPFTGNPPLLDFGKVLSGATAVASFSVVNIGFGDLYLQDIVLSQGSPAYYEIKDLKLNSAASTLPLTIREQNTDTVTFTLQFKPGGPGTAAAALKFVNSDPKHQDFTINVTGRALFNKGDACVLDADCNTTHCADDVCCESECSKACQSCSQQGYKGTCKTVLFGADPKGICAPTPFSTCGTTGNCLDVEKCEVWPASTVCAGAACIESNTKLKMPRFCSGDVFMECLDSAEVNCLPYVCDPLKQPPACLTSCASNQDCGAGYGCDTSKSSCRLVAGRKCNMDTECLSGFCTDGYCCKTRCDGVCEQCSQAGKEGSCEPVPADADPDEECQADDPSTCQRNGFCSGSRNCKLHGNAAECLAASCSGNTLNKAHFCSGTGACTEGGTQSCSPYICASAACKTSCSSNGDCVPGYSCDAQNKCKANDGTSCAADAQCASGFCTDGVCCKTRCNGICEECGQAGYKGLCQPVAADTDPGNDCPDDLKPSCDRNGFCDGNRTCRLYPEGTECASASCSGDTLILPDKCDGSGNCIDKGSQDCSPYACSGGKCKGSCASDLDCAAGRYCDLADKTCRKKLGDPCSLDAECVGGFCTDGVCCNERCNGICESCKLQGAVGACTAAPDGSDPRNDCPVDDVSTCKRTGDCDGKRACKLYSNSTICVAAECTGNTANYAHLCSGGVCQEGGSTACGLFACVGGACRTSCSSDQDCVQGYSCVIAEHVCRKSTGSGCINDTDCQSGFCVDGYCCNARCNGTCESCNLSGKTGSCEAIPDGQDPQGECPGFACSGYYSGWTGGNNDECWNKADVPDVMASCNGNRGCHTAAELCPLQANSQLKVNCDNTCQKPDSTSCTGTAAGACLNLDLGEETCGKGECLVTVKKCLNGVPQVCIPKNPAPAETCNNGKDDDCDGIIDNPPGQTKPQCNVCGDGIIDNLEACDHSNLDPGIGCSTDCRTILCGEPNEARHSLDPSTKTCYWRRNDNENWDGAQGRCGDRRGFLVQTETQAEREYLFANLVVPGGWGSKCWIGAKRDGSTVKWADGTTASAPGFVWGDGKPQGLGDCIMTVGVENDLGYDNDMCLLATHDYICERPLRGTPR